MAVNISIVLLKFQQSTISVSKILFLREKIQKQLGYRMSFAYKQNQVPTRKDNTSNIKIMQNRLTAECA